MNQNHTRSNGCMTWGYLKGANILMIFLQEVAWVLDLRCGVPVLSADKGEDVYYRPEAP